MDWDWCKHDYLCNLHRLCLFCLLGFCMVFLRQGLPIVLVILSGFWYFCGISIIFCTIGFVFPAGCFLLIVLLIVVYCVFSLCFIFHFVVKFIVIECCHFCLPIFLSNDLYSSHCSTISLVLNIPFWKRFLFNTFFTPWSRQVFV